MLIGSIVARSSTSKMPPAEPVRVRLASGAEQPEVRRVAHVDVVQRGSPSLRVELRVTAAGLGTSTAYVRLYGMSSGT